MKGIDKPKGIANPQIQPRRIANPPERGFVEPVYEPRDFISPSFLLNQSLYNQGLGMEADGGVSSNGIASGGYMNSYGYYVTHYANSVHNYCFPYSQFLVVFHYIICRQNRQQKTSPAVCKRGL